jgi:uncharacterized protein YndB with AHSA1/START domain
MKNKTEVIAEAGKQELFIIREFDASPEKVYRAWTDPQLLVQWMAPCDFTTTIDRMENHDGGSWRFVYTDKKGNAFAFRGVHHELVPGVRIIRTFEFEGLPEKGHATMETIRFEKLADGRTKTVIQAVFQSLADRDGRVQAGVEQGVIESYKRLDELLSQQ